MKKRIFLVVLIMFFIFPRNLYASDDIYDVVLFWGQSNMVGYAGVKPSTNDKSGEDRVDKRFQEIGVDTFSQVTGIDKEILNKYTAMNHVDVDINDGTVYEYLYGSNSLRVINKDTETLGENLKYLNNTLVLYSKDPSLQTNYFSLEESYGTNMVPQFAKNYYEKTGHKVIVVMGAKGGEAITHFMPYDDVKKYAKTDDENLKEQHIYESMVMKYNAAIGYLNNNNMKIGNMFYVVLQGETDAGWIQQGAYSGDDYASYLKMIHDYLKRDCGLEFGVIVHNSHVNGYVGIDNRYSGVNAVYNAKNRLIDNNTDIILGSSYIYDIHIPTQADYNSAKYNGLSYDEALQYANYSNCFSDVGSNSVHLTSAALSQVGMESANNTHIYLVDSDNEIKNRIGLDYFYNINAGTSVGNLINNISFGKDKKVITGLSASVMGLDSILKTGDQIIIDLRLEKITNKISVLGDLDSDGYITDNDIEIVFDHIINTNISNDLYINAADFDNNLDIDINDVIKLSKSK